MSGFVKGETVFVRNEDGSVESGDVLYQRMAPPDYDRPVAVCVMIGMRSAVYPMDRVSVTRPPIAGVGKEALGADVRDELMQQVEDEIFSLVEGGEVPMDLELEPLVEEMVARAEEILGEAVTGTLRDEIVEIVLGVQGDFVAK